MKKGEKKSQIFATLWFLNVWILLSLLKFERLVDSRETECLKNSPDTEQTAPSLHALPRHVGPNTL